MAIAETAHLIVDLRLQDQLTPAATKARAAIAGLEAQAKQTTSGFGGLGSVLKTTALGLGAFAGVTKVADLIGDTIDAASALNETLSKSKVIFGDAAGEIEKFGDSAATSVGLSKQAAVEAAATFGNLFNTIGLAPAKAVPMSEALVTLAGDLASFNNIPVDEALEKLRSGLAGEAEPLRTVGVLLNESAVAAEAARLGFTKANGVFTEAQKVQARYSLILQQTKTAQGDFARTSDGLANSQRILAANVANLSAKVGTALIPTLTDLVQKLNNEVIPAIGKTADALGPVAGAIGTVDNAVKQATGGIGIFSSAFEILGSLIDATTTQFNKMASAAGLVPPVVVTLDGTAKALGGTLGIVGGVIDTVVGSLHQGTTATQEFTAEVAKTATLATNIDELTSSWDDDTDAINRAWLAAQNLRSEIDQIPREVGIAINIRTRRTEEGGPGLPPGSADVEPGSQFGTGAGDQAALDARERSRQTQNALNAQRQADADRRRAEAKAAADKAANEAEAEAKRRAQELAQANREKVAASYDDIKRAADRLFDSLHDRHIKAIQDAERLAQKQHDAAIQRIDDALKVAEAENAKPANEAERAQNAREQAEARRNLVEALQGAQAAQLTNQDPARAADLARSVRDATEALQNFDARATIGRLRGTEDVLNAQAEAQAKRDRDRADADLEAAKAKAAAQEQAVTVADKKKSEDFGRALDALRKKDEQDPRKFLTDAKALEARFGIFTDERGFRHIGDAVAGSLAKVKFPPPIVNLTNKFSVTLNGRDIAAAVASANQPSAAPGVRSGQAGRAA